jgi:hypothetical protein
MGERRYFDAVLASCERIPHRASVAPWSLVRTRNKFWCWIYGNSLQQVNVQRNRGAGEIGGVAPALGV